MIQILDYQIVTLLTMSANNTTIKGVEKVNVAEHPKY